MDEVDKILDNINYNSEVIGAIKMLYYFNEIGGLEPRLTDEQINKFAKAVIEASKQKNSKEIVISNIEEVKV